LIEKLNALRLKLESRKVEATWEMTGEMKDALAEVTAIDEKDGLEALEEAEEIFSWRTKLEEMANKLHL
jgi:hypothetical protein